jgi:thymidylate synthase
MRVFTGIDEAYREVLREVWHNSDYNTAPRGLPIREKVDYSFLIMYPTSEPIKTLDLERNKVIEEYTKKEVALYDSGSNKVEDFAKASKFWEKLANPDGTINSAYGFLIWKNYSCTSIFDDVARTPWEWARDSLIADKDTRQAIMRFSLPEHQFMSNKDQTCTMHGNWLIRNNRLNLTITMRSQDMVKGAVYDWPWFISLMDKMLVELKDKYPTLERGHYTHFVHSMHCYEKDSETILKMIGEK